MPPTRFSTEINRLRAALRGHHGEKLIDTVRREIERLPVAALVADNAQRYVAVNEAAVELTGYTRQELGAMSILDLTPVPHTADSGRLWETFISQGGQRGEYELIARGGPARPVRYWAFASIAPGLHISLLVPKGPAANGGG